MLNVLIVDDDFLAYNYIKTLIDWNQYGYCILGQASNGVEALDMIRNNRPDVIFLDVSMPKMDGIELIRVLHDEYPQILVIILSSYSDFDYVREAMKLGAFDYLLKHRLTDKTLITLLNAIKKQVHNMDLSDKHADLDNVNNHGIIQDSRTRSFFKGGYNGIPPSLHQVSLPVIAVAKIKHIFKLLPEYSMSQITLAEQKLQAMLTTCQQICSTEPNASTVYLGQDQLVFVFSALTKEKTDEQVERVTIRMNIIQDAILKYHNSYIDFVVGSRCNKSEEIADEYQRVTNILQNKKAEQDAFPQKIAKRSVIQLSIEQERQIINCVLSKDYSALHQTIEGIFGALPHQDIPIYYFNILSGDFLTLLLKLYNLANISFEPSEYTNINFTCVHDYIQYFENMFVNLIDSMPQYKSFSKAVRSLVDYINDNYMKDISLRQLSEQLSLNPSYTSTLFKNETGINLNTYINRIRIYNACKIFVFSDDTPTHIFERVGFHNYNHFFNVFKNVTGMTPTEFKQRAGLDWIVMFNPFKE